MDEAAAKLRIALFSLPDDLKELKQELVKLGSSSEDWKTFVDAVEQTMLEARTDLMELSVVYDKCHNMLMEMELAAKKNIWSKSSGTCQKT